MTVEQPPVCETCGGHQVKDHSDHHWLCTGCGKMMPKAKYTVQQHIVKPNK